MSNQIVISSGAKVRSLEGVLTGTAGIVNSVPLGGANGVATLDSMGKVPLSQLPASVVTYLGTWNAATNTPTLTNGVGDVGDLYICNVAGTVNFGAGPITFAVGDWVIYSGTEWQKSAGASGTVTSVAVTESGDALTITGSPITTSGTINIGFAGTGSQYIKGDGTLATFPTTIDQAKRLITEVYNSTGATLSKGTVVYINGGQGNLPTVTKAQANADNTSAQTYGVVQSDITNMNNGFVVVFGSLTDIDTQAYAVGTQLYLSGTTAGAWTSTKPSAPIHLVYVGIVVRSHPTQGVVEIRIQNGYELEELHDVAISAPVNNQGIFYNSSNDLWENKSIATALGYTPANDALVVHLAGTETITGAKTFTDNTIFSASPLFDQSANYKVGASLVGTGNYIAMAFDKSGTGSGSILSMKLADGTTAKAINLDFLGSPATYTYTFPDLSGTLALLEGTQTFSGNKTFSALTAFTFLNGTRMDYGLYLSKGSVPSAFSGSTVNLYSDSGNNNLVVRDNSNTSLLQFQAASSYTYTFPASSGTLALTSNLSSYVPYTGATTNVDLGSNFLKARTFYSEGSGGGGSYAIKNGTTPSFEDGYTILSSNDYRLNIVSTVSAATKAVYFGFSGVTATRTYTLPDATGTIALTSNLSSYVPYTGATGAVNLGSNALTALTLYSNAGLGLSNSGQFTGGGGYTGINGRTDGIDIRPNNGGIFQFIFSNTTSRTYTLPDATGTIVLGTGTTNYLPKFTGASTIGNSLIFDNGTNLGIGTSGTTYASTTLLLRATSATSTNYSFIVEDNATNQLFAIRNTGAATFSSSVTANGVMSLSDDGTYGSNYKTLGFTGNTNGNHRIFAGVTDGMFICSKTGEGIFFRVNGGTTNNLTISSAGNVGIGTSSPGFPLEVYKDTTGYATINVRNPNTTVNSGASIRLYSSGYDNMPAEIINKPDSTGGTLVFNIRKADGSYNDFVTFRGDGNIRMNSAVFGNTTSGTTRTVYIGNGDYFLGGISSVRASKKNINDISNIDWVYQLNPVTFNYRKKDEQGNYTEETYDDLNYGLIAEDTAPIADFLINYNDKEDGTKEMVGIEYPRLIIPLLKAIQELNAKVTALENK